MRINLLSTFDRTFQHYRAPIDSLFAVYPQPEEVLKIRKLGIKLILISRMAEISIRLVNDSFQFVNARVLDEMELYMDLLEELFMRYQCAFDKNLHYEGLLTTVWECMVNVQNTEVDEVVENVRKMFREMKDNPYEPGNEDESHAMWSRLLIAWRCVVMSRQQSIQMMRNWLFYVLRLQST